MKVNGKNFESVWFKKGKLKLIDQTLLPFQFKIFESKNSVQTAKAINSMIVRGAPAIGATGAFGLAQAALEFNGKDFGKFCKHVSNAKKILAATRPTAKDLFTGLDFVEKSIAEIVEKEFANNPNSELVSFAKKASLNAAQNYSNSIVKNCEAIGNFGNKLVPKNAKILNHCNAGWLATVDWGTALSPIYKAKRSGKKVFVFVDETRPRLQGAQLTAWELEQEKIPHAIIADNAAGYFLNKKEIDLCIVGADRIALNGDFANKIGTYEKAVLAKENGIPFYVAAPLTTFDLDCDSGKKIPIEERNEEEVLIAKGINERGKFEKIRIANPKSSALNPAFDVTPAKYVSGIITEKGIISARESSVKKIFKK